MSRAASGPYSDPRDDVTILLSTAQDGNSLARMSSSADIVAAAYTSVQSWLIVRCMWLTPALAPSRIPTPSGA